jgi:hypothetical protein
MRRLRRVSRFCASKAAHFKKMDAAFDARVARAKV